MTLAETEARIAELEAEITRANLALACARNQAAIRYFATSLEVHQSNLKVLHAYRERLLARRH